MSCYICDEPACVKVVISHGTPFRHPLWAGLCRKHYRAYRRGEFDRIEPKWLLSEMLLAAVVLPIGLMFIGGFVYAVGYFIYALATGETSWPYR